MLWEDGTDNIRYDWRQNRLLEDKKIEVTAPIRYGRVSKNRAKTYTMVLSTNAAPGRAFVMPCQKALNDYEDLLEEALHLWRAEALKKDGTAVSASWGCVALMVRDKSQFQKVILDSWANLVASKQREFDIPHAHNETSLVSSSGILQLPWPSKPDGDPLTEVDVLLATTNHPTLNHRSDYADPNDIAMAWLRAPAEDYYFYKNREHGIKTFQDDEILGEFWRASSGGCGGICL